MKNGKKTTIILVLIILVIGVIFFAYKNEKKIYKEEINRNKMFAIMIEKGDGKYIEYRSKKWPEYGYKYNKEKTKCVDRDRKDIGNIIEYDARINEATMKSRRSAYCTLYFDIDNEPPQPGDIYIGKNENQEYTNNRNEEIHIKIDDDNATEYCLVNEKDSSKCEWKAIPELDESNWFVTTEHTLTEGDEKKSVYLYLKDGAKNISEEQDASIRLDQTPPSCSISGNPTSWQATNATLTQNGTDSGEGTVYYSWDNENSYSTTKVNKNVSANGTYILYVKDGLGNKTSCNVSVTKIDKSGPNLTITNKVDGKTYNESWTNKNISSVLSFSDDGIGIDASSLKWKATGTNPKDWTSISNTSTTEYSGTWSSEREGTAYYKICDILGNCTTKSFAIKIDTTAPTIEFSLDGQTAKYTCSNGGSGSPLSGTTSGSRALSGTSNYKYTATCKDEAGNEKTDSHTYTYDSCLSSSCNEGWSYYGCFVAYSTSSNCRANCAGSCYEEDSDEYGGGISGSWICKLCKYWDNCAATTCVGGFKY